MPAPLPTALKSDLALRSQEVHLYKFDIKQEGWSLVQQTVAQFEGSSHFFIPIQE